MLDDFVSKPNRFKLQTKGVIIISECLPTEIHYMRESHIAVFRTVTVLISDKSVLLGYGEYHLKVSIFVTSTVL